MAIVPIRDDYTETAEPGILYQGHTPVWVGGRALMITNRGSGGGGSSDFALFSIAQTDGPQARLYDVSTADWTRGDPLPLSIDPTDARACAATLDGNVLVQGQVHVPIVEAVAPPVSTGLTLGSGVPSMLRISDNCAMVAQRFRVSTTAQIVLVTVRFDSVQPGDPTPNPSATITASITTNTTGGAPLATSPAYTIPDYTQEAGFTFSNLNLAPGVDYYLTFTATQNLLISRLAGVGSTAHFGPLDTTFSTQRYDDGVLFATSNTIWAEFSYISGPATTTTSYVEGTGYAVLDVNGDTVTEGVHTPVIGTNHGLNGPCRTAPEAMVRIPLTNRFWAWRNYFDTGQCFVDLLQITGTNVKVLASAPATTGTLFAHTPCAIISISPTEAISLLSLPDKLKLVHMSVDSAGIITVNLQDVVGYPTIEEASLVPGLKFQADLLVKAAGTDPLQLIRLGIAWSGTSFNITALPITQLAAGIKPPGYTPRVKTASVSVVTGSSQAASNGAHITARRYDTNGSDDNWILLTEYDQSDGTIVCNTWVKGDVNGGRSDQLLLDALSLRIDPGSDRLLVGSTEIHLAGGADTGQTSSTPRMGVFRRNYNLDAYKRSQRQEFER